MKLMKYGLLALLVGSFSSCVKSVNDFAGMRTDKGGIVTSITETQYLNVDNQNIQYHYSVFANFSFSTANEDVRFFHLRVAQPREVKMSGPMVVKFTTSNVPGYDALPAGALTVTDVTIPASTADAFDVPVTFAVNKSALNPANHYAVRFTIASVSQGVYSELDKSIDVIINGHSDYNTSRYGGLYKWTSTVVDPSKQYSVFENSKNVFFEENVANNIEVFDHQYYGLYGNVANAYKMWVYNQANTTAAGAAVYFYKPTYTMNASGKVTGITISAPVSGATITNVQLDAATSNQFTYTNNGDRTMDVKYTFSLTTAAGGTRTITVTEKFSYAKIQAFYEY